MNRSESLLPSLELLLGVSHKPDLLELLLNMALNDIKEYCRIDEIPERYDTAIIKLAASYYQKRVAGDGVVQQSQGSRSVTYKDGIPESIKQSLPLPRIKVV